MNQIYFLSMSVIKYNPNIIHLVSSMLLLNLIRYKNNKATNLIKILQFQNHFKLLIM